MLKIIILGLVLAAVALSGAVSVASAKTVPSPLQQVRDGVPTGEVMCSENRVLMVSQIGMPACVFEESVLKLETRGFEFVGKPFDTFPIKSSDMADSTLWTGDAWPILDLSASLPRYAFAQVQDSTPPTFVSSGLDITTRVLSITFSETIDATSVDPTKIHIRESGNYTGGITLTAGELGTVADGNAISFILTSSHSAAVAVLAAPELTIDPGAVRDASGNAIASTLDTSTASHVYTSSIIRHNTKSTDVEFSNDGLRMFTVDSKQQRVNEYVLFEAFDLSAGSGFVDSFSVYPRMLTPFKMAFSNDGTKMFVIGITQDREQESISTGVPIAPTGQSRTWAIDKYTLSTAFDVSTAQYVDSSSLRTGQLQPSIRSDILK